jgi:SAM-dependent methyltransferase
MAGERSIGLRLWGALPWLRRGPGFRERTVGHVTGRVLEIGFGYGDNLPLYHAASSVWAIEPDPDGFAQAARLARQTPIPVTIARAVAEALPFADGSFDAVVGMLVFCSVHNPAGALTEVRRVLRPSGMLHLFEHVRAPQPWLAWFQDRVSRPWESWSGGCHVNRDTAASLRAAGFAFQHYRSRYAGLIVEIVASPES